MSTIVSFGTYFFLIFNLLAKLDVGYLSLDISSDGSILAVGTEKDGKAETVFVEFW